MPFVHNAFASEAPHAPQDQHLVEHTLHQAEVFKGHFLHAFRVPGLPFCQFLPILLHR